MSFWASQAHTFHQPVCQRCLDCTIRAFYMSIPVEPSLLQVQILSAKLRKKLIGPDGENVLRLDIADLFGHCPVIPLQTLEVWLSMTKSHWHGALCSAHKGYTRSHVSWKKGGGKRELVAAPWTSSRQFSYVLWLKVHSHQLLRTCLLGSKRKLSPRACQVQLWLPSAVCRPKGMQFPGTMDICNRVPCQALEPTAFLVLRRCRRCCCWPFQCDRQFMETRLNSAGGPGPYHRSSSFLHLLSFLSPPLLIYKSRASWHIPQAIQWW